MRWFPCAVATASLVWAQHSPDLGPSGTATIPEGSATKRIILSIDTPPENGDRFVVSVSTGKVRFVLVTPDGQRITSEHVPKGFAWTNDPSPPPLGSADGGYSMVIDFTGPNKPGRYVLELTGENLSEAARAVARFISNRREYAAIMKGLQGFRRVGPVIIEKAGASGNLDISVDREEQSGIFDIVVTDSAAHISLTLPDGRTLDESSDGMRGVEWKKLSQVSDIDAPGSWVGI